MYAFYNLRLEYIAWMELSKIFVPLEAILYIASYCGIKDVLSLIKTCKALEFSLAFIRDETTEGGAIKKCRKHHSYCFTILHKECDLRSCIGPYRTLKIICSYCNKNYCCTGHWLKDECHTTSHDKQVQTWVKRSIKSVL
jgi:hypothetical protein